MNLIFHFCVKHQQPVINHYYLNWDNEGGKLWVEAGQIDGIIIREKRQNT